MKELVHGDFTRTRPNLASLLGCHTDILALDVEEVRVPDSGRRSVMITVSPGDAGLASGCEDLVV